MMSSAEVGMGPDDKIAKFLRSQKGVFSTNPEL
jgi:hypothetical protein